MTDGPILWRFDGEHLVPATARWKREVEKRLTVDAEYWADPQEPRSQASHNQYFAALNEAWMNLPEHQAEHFPTVEHLRKFALIKAGYCDSQSIACASRAEALRVAAFVRSTDDYAIVTVTEAVVTRYTAKSQSHRAMGKAVFQASKQAVLDVVSQLIGVKAHEMGVRIPAERRRGLESSGFVYQRVNSDVCKPL